MMKKTLIITIIIFLISAVVTVSCAVALGVTEFKQYIESGKLSDLFYNLDDLGEKIEEKLDSALDFDIDFEHEHEHSDEDKKLLYEESDEQEYTKDTIVIGSDASEIILMPSNGKNRIAQMKIYSRINTRYECNDFSLKVNFNDCDIYVKQNEQTAVTSAKLYVYIPECVKNVVVKSSAGDIELKNLSLSSIDISLDAGEVDLSSTKAEKCSVNVNAGNIELEDNFSAGELNACVNTGNIKYELPYDSSVEIKYSVDIGKIDLHEVTEGYIIYDKDKNVIKVPKSEGTIEFIKAYSSKMAAVDFKVSVGEIEIEQDN